MRIDRDSGRSKQMTFILPGMHFCAHSAHERYVQTKIAQCTIGWYLRDEKIDVINLEARFFNQRAAKMVFLSWLDCWRKSCYRYSLLNLSYPLFSLHRIHLEANIWAIRDLLCFSAKWGFRVNSVCLFPCDFRPQLRDCPNLRPVDQCNTRLFSRSIATNQYSLGDLY
jgi:hypothetical protein